MQHRHATLLATSLFVTALSAFVRADGWVHLTTLNHNPIAGTTKTVKTVTNPGPGVMTLDACTISVDLDDLVCGDSRDDLPWAAPFATFNPTGKAPKPCNFGSDQLLPQWSADYNVDRLVKLDDDFVKHLPDGETVSREHRVESVFRCYISKYGPTAPPGPGTDPGLD